MYFRPFPVLTLIAIPAVAALLWLGAWQAGRAGWKSKLIDDYERAIAAGPQQADRVLCALPGVPGSNPETNQPIEGAGVISGMLGGWPPQGRSVRMFSQTSGGEAGWYKLFAGRPPPCLAEEGAIVVQGYFEPFNPVPERPGPAFVGDLAPSSYLVRAWPQKPAFTAANSPETNDWHWFDAPALAKALGVPKINDRFYLAVFSGDLPAYLTRTPPATHIGYSATWYGMAIALVVIYALFHARAGRLRFRNRNPAQ